MAGLGPGGLEHRGSATDTESLSVKVCISLNPCRNPSSLPLELVKAQKKHRIPPCVLAEAKLGRHRGRDASSDSARGNAADRCPGSGGRGRGGGGGRLGFGFKVDRDFFGP